MNVRKRAYKIAVLLGRNPDVTVAPFAEISKFLYFRMLVLNIVFDRQAGRIVDAYVGTESGQYSRTLKCQ